MVDPDLTGVTGDSELYPWLDKNDLIETPLAIVQAWGYQGVKPEDKFQVCYLVMPLVDKFDKDGQSLPAAGCFSLDAESPENPRRRVLEWFANPENGAFGPVQLLKLPADNPQGWVWAMRKCPMPAESIDYAEREVKRQLYRQAWRPQALANYNRRKAAIAAAAQAALAAAPSNGTAAVQGALPF